MDMDARKCLGHEQETDTAAELGDWGQTEEDRYTTGYATADLDINEAMVVF